MFTDCSLLRSNFLPVKVSAVNSTGPSNVQLIQVSVYTGPLLQKKIKGENVYFCLDTLEKLSMQCRVYFMQVFLDIKLSSVCMNVAELYFLLFQVSQWLS